MTIEAALVSYNMLCQLPFRAEVKQARLTQSSQQD